MSDIARKISFAIILLADGDLLGLLSALLLGLVGAVLHSDLVTLMVGDISTMLLRHFMTLCIGHLSLIVLGHVRALVVGFSHQDLVVALALSLVFPVGGRGLQQGLWSESQSFLYSVLHSVCLGVWCMAHAPS